MSDSSTSGATGSAEPAEAAGSARRRRPSWLVIVLVAALVAVLVGLAVLWKQNRDLAQDRDLQQAEAAATQEASRIAVSMTSYDSKSVDKDFAWVHDDGTAKFEQDYAKSTATIRKLIVRTGAHAEGRVSEAAGTATDPTHVTVVLFVDQTLQRPGDRQPSVDSSRVVMDMVRRNGRWLVNSVELR